MDETMLPMKTTAQMVRSGIASAVGGADVVRYCSCVLPGEQRGYVSVTVVDGSGRRRTLMYLVGSRTYDDVVAFNPGPDHDVHVVHGVVDEQYIANHVRAWLGAA